MKLLSRYAIVGVAIALIASPGVAANGNTSSMPQAEHEDTLRMASELDLDPEEALAQQAVQTEFNSYAQDLRGKYPASYVTAGFHPDGKPYIGFTDLPIPAADIEAMFADVDVVSGLPLSEVDLVAINNSLFYQLSDIHSGEEELSVTPMPLTGRIEVLFDDPTLASSAASAISTLDRDTTVSALLDRNHIASLEDIVDVKVENTLDSRVDASIAGGQKLTRIGSTSLNCTAGFSAKRGSTPGLSTAEHCRNDMDTDGLDYIYNASRYAPREDGDVQWHSRKSPTTVLGTFRYNWGSYRPVWANVNATPGTSVCRFGAKTGSGCSSVYQVNVCIDYDDAPAYCGLVRTHRHTGSTGGDSGGPWYYGNNAYGIHSGSGWYGGIHRNYFTPTYTGLAAAGLTIIYG